MSIPKKALILAAGLGSRLVPITNDIPKSLVQVNGTPILFKQIGNLHENGINDITIISGYKADILERAVHENWPEVDIVESVNYEKTNNMYSAYLGIREMFQDKDIQPFVMMNADVFYDASVLTALLEFQGEDAVVTDIGRYIPESMKVTEKEGILTAISKSIVEQDALGSTIDVYKFSAMGAKAFFEACRQYIEKYRNVNLWSEVALDKVLKEKTVPFTACPLKGRWFEIDTHEDLAAAALLFS